MAKNKQQKQKERERRVAREKLAAAQQRAQKKKTTKEIPKTGSRSKKLTSAVAAPKADYVAASKKSPFTQRRGGG